MGEGPLVAAEDVEEEEEEDDVGEDVPLEVGVGVGWEDIGLDLELASRYKVLHTRFEHTSKPRIYSFFVRRVPLPHRRRFLQQGQVQEP